MENRNKFRQILIYAITILLVGCTTKKALITKQTLSPQCKYELNLSEFKNDKIAVKVHVNHFQNSKAVFCFPKIVPGIYGEMDFGKYINSLIVKDRNGNLLSTRKIDVNCWEIENASKIASIEYQVDDMLEEFKAELSNGFYKSAASMFKEDVFMINHNCLFGYFKGFENAPVELLIHKPQEFYGATSLTKVKSTQSQDEYRAKSYRELVDNPIMYSLPDTTLIALPTITVQVACYSTTKQPISKEISTFIKPLLENQSKYLNNKLPVDNYTFIIYHSLNDINEDYMGDGLEHSNSTLCLFYMPFNLDMLKVSVYGIASHEFFHTLMPLGIHSHEIAYYDYNNPKFSQHLWLYEGMTEYFTIHMPIKNGIQNMPEFLEVLEAKIENMNKFDNTLSFTEMSRNVMQQQDQYYNVYLKGAMINLCLDIYLRELSNGKYGVQDLVSDLFAKYGKDKSFEDEQLFDEIVLLTGFPELKDFFNNYVVAANELPLKEMLGKVGLELQDGKIIEQPNLSEKQKKLRYSWINN